MTFEQGSGPHDQALLDATTPVGTTDIRFEELAEDAAGYEARQEHVTPSGGEVGGSGTLLRQMFRTYRQNKLAVFSLVYVVLLVIGCIVVPIFQPQSYWANAPANFASSCFNNTAAGSGGNVAPSHLHWLGCTGGFDTIQLIFYSGRFSLLIGLLSGVVTMVVGTTYGIVAGYKGAWTDSILMRMNDVFLSIPGLYLLILIIVLFGSDVQSLVIVIGGTSWFGVARLMRSEAQLLRDREYSQAARAMGATGRRVMWKHVLPNAVSTMVTAATFAVGDAVIALSTLGFLGFGLQPPDYDWGTLIQIASGNFILGRWWTLWPVAGVFILFVLATNYIGDALRDAFEVRLLER